ncbi:MAG: exosortase B [Betaproteobacteria bacterium CG2_30_68_42]|nr:MAG: exosortase B [Betaproteobacteria bacterium CG2_30_68_42]
MASVLPSSKSSGLASGELLRWAPVALGLALLYGPTYWDLAHGLWNTEEQAHGPIVAAVALFLIWQNRAALAAAGARPRDVAGGALLGFGLLLYVLGRSQDILLFEIGSQIPVLAGTLLVAAGAPALRALWFPVLFVIFMVPLPGFLVDAATGPLKQMVSLIAENLLYAAGYPIGRSGVVLTIGPYQLLVADACSGLNSMFSLSALGLLYLYLMRHASWLRNGALIASILPIAFAANAIRVIVLVLVTYHLGDEAGQGFLHGAAGIVLFIAALLLLFALDGLIGLFAAKRAAS